MRLYIQFMYQNQHMLVWPVVWPSEGQWKLVGSPVVCCNLGF